MTTRILLSAYSCEPDKGSEPGAGYSLIRAASELGECWVLTRGNNVASLDLAIGEQPPRNPIHVVAVDGPDWTLAAKRRFGLTRAYYVLWQRIARGLARELDDAVGGFDIVHHVTMSAFWLPVGIARLDRPVVIGPISGGTFTPRSLLRLLGPKGLVRDVVRAGFARIRAGTVRRQWRNVSVLLAQNREMAVFTRRHSLVPATTPVVRVSHGIEPAVAIPRTLTGRRREVVFVGRLVGWKGVIAAVDAFARARVGDARLVFIGDGSDRPMIEKRVRSRGLTDRVEFTGPLDRPVVLERMRHAACLLFPSFHDSAGFVVSEALSLGLPVVCLDHGGPGELVRSWPDIPSDAVPVSTLDETINRLAVAIERFVEDLVPIPPEIAVASTTLSSTLARVYRMALDPAGTDRVDGVM